MQLDGVHKRTNWFKGTNADPYLATKVWTPFFQQTTTVIDEDDDEEKRRRIFRNNGINRFCISAVILK